jgi:hypothetical protein
MLTDDDFKRIVRGEVITREERNGDKIVVALQDIGWVRMIEHIDDAVHKRKT